MKFSAKDAKQFSFRNVKGLSYMTGEDFENISASVVETKGAILPVKNKKSDRIYYVIEGEGEFVVGEKKYEVSESDVVIVPKNTFYSYKTLEGFKLLEVNTPAFDLEYEVRSRR